MVGYCNGRVVGAEFFGNAGNSCNLQSINLYNLVKNKFTKDARIDYDLLVKNVKLSIDMLNQTLDYGYDMQPLDMNRKCIDDWRSIGLGVFGLADMFVALGVRYGSKESVDLVADLFERINYTTLEESCNLARINKPFGKYDWNKTKESYMIKELQFTNETLYNKIMKDGLRNGTLISVAPTGTLSLFAGGLAGGVEPIFKVSYERTTHSTEDKGIKFRVFAKSVKELLEYNSLPLTTSDEEIKKLFPFIVESQELNPTDRIRVQSIMQQYVDNAISSTINLSKGTTTEEISNIYLDSWKQGLKGITVFVDDCKRANILGVTDKKDNEIVFDSIVPEKRRKIKKVNGNTYKKETSCVPSMYVTVNRNATGDIFEVFTATSSGCKSNIGTITRLVSYALRSGSSVKGIINELKENKCEACQLLRRKGNKEISSSCGNAIAEALEEEYNNGKEVKEVSTDGLMQCPECKEYSLKKESHCATCGACGWSACS